MNIPEITTAALGHLVKTLDHDFNWPRDDLGRVQVMLTGDDVVPGIGETVIVEDRGDDPPLRLRGRVAFMIAVITDEVSLAETLGEKP